MWRVGAKRISDDEGTAALALWASGRCDDEDIARACRYVLQILKTNAPGSSVEIRVPPYAAIQAIPGPAHTRGTPPAVVEMDPEVCLELAVGKMAFSEAVSRGLVRASGERSDLSDWLPVLALP